jgi:hypothetical protein
MDQTAENVRLIDAAPDLLAALIKFRDVIQAFEGDLQARGLPAQIAFGDAIEKAKAAIAKAEGR